MADFTAKKAKVMDHLPRIRHCIQLEVEPESEGRLQCVKSQLQHMKSVLRITSRTLMGNLLMIEKLLQFSMSLSTEEWQARSLCFLHRVKNRATANPAHAMLQFKRIFFPCMSWLVGKT